tara:strand:- start:217 stop:1020 length:804 start_codon:yes stop_codon:yes gene_type:complete
MPEGPEVRITATQLNDLLTEKTLQELNFVDGKYTMSNPDGYAEFDLLTPSKIKSVNCKGKTLYFTFESVEDGKKHYAFHSLMMSGRWTRSWDKYCKWYIETTCGTTVWFSDPRALGTIRFTSSQQEFERTLDRLGPDVLSPELTTLVFKNLCRKYSNRNITSFLMDQQVLAGIGNYLKAEILYASCIAPTRKVSSISQEEVLRLLSAIRTLPREALAAKGMTLRDYASPDGNDGGYQFSLKVYGKKGATRLKTSDGRITYWDPKKQK